MSKLWEIVVILTLLFAVGLVGILTAVGDPGKIIVTDREKIVTTTTTIPITTPRPAISVTIPSLLTTTTTTTEPPPSTTTTKQTTTTTVAQRRRSDEEDRVWRIYERSVPQHWKARIVPDFRVIRGSTSWAEAPNKIEISRYHVRSSDRYLAVIITHEYGHLIAFNYGTRKYNGAPPEGWPPRTDRPEEHWADCVQQAFLGFAEPTRGLPPCEGEQLSWARNYLSK